MKSETAALENGGATKFLAHTVHRAFHCGAAHPLGIE
jgi:hypothetical protein